jgi:hypothetical protein
MIQQFAMMITNQPSPQQFANQNRLRVTAGGGALSIPAFAPTQHWAPAQQWVPPGGRGLGGNGSSTGRGHRNQRGPVQGTLLPFVGENQMIPYIPAGVQPPPCQIPGTQTWLSSGPTKTYVSVVVSTWTIGILAPPSPVRKLDIKMNSLAPTTWNTNAPTISSATRLCTRRCTQICDS